MSQTTRTSSSRSEGTERSESLPDPGLYQEFLTNVEAFPTQVYPDPTRDDIDANQPILIGEESDRFNSLIDMFADELDEETIAKFDFIIDEAEREAKMLDKFAENDDVLDSALLDMFGGAGSLRQRVAKRRYEYARKPMATASDTVSTVTPESVRTAKLIERMNNTPWASGTENHVFISYKRGHDYIWIEDHKGKRVSICGIPNGANPPTFKFKIIVNVGYTKASVISEETKSKGTGLGFSSFLHLASICSLASDKNFTQVVLEPIEGHDVSVEGISFEMTGLNYRKRKSSAQFILNKYAIFKGTHGEEPKYSRLIEWSLAEDRRDTSFLKGTFFDNGPSPYSKYADRMHELNPLVTRETQKTLVNYLERYIADMPLEEQLIGEPKKHNLELLRRQVFENLKKHGYPTPFFCLPAIRGCTSDGSERSIDIRPYQIINGGESTRFRTWDSSETYEQRLFEYRDVDCGPSSNFTNLYDGLFAYLMRFTIFQAIYLESELLPKIHGKEGCFYSEHTRVGICWKITNVGSLTYNVSFYQTWKPERESLVGKWSFGTCNDIPVYQSPTFKINKGEIHFAACLPYKILVKTASCLAYITEESKLQVIMTVLRIAAVQRHSTWQTSKMCGDFRYITLCSLAGSGDPVGLCVKGISGCLTMPLSFPNYYLSRLMLDFCAKYNGEPLDKTPIFDLPVRFLSMEKDLPLGLYWHLRSESHDTNCVKKMLDSVKTEESERDEAVMFYERQVEFLEDLLINGRTSYTAYRNLLNSKPNFPLYNHVLFIALSSKASSSLKESAGQRQWPTGASIHGMITDHKMADIKLLHGKFEGSIMNDSTVAEGIARHLRQIGGAIGIHDLLLKQSFLEPRPLVYTLHAKDAKSSDREISQMMPYMRPSQFFSESMNSIYSDSEDTDMMTDTAKFFKIVRNFQPLLRKGGISRSEDKSFFCGNLHPEFMSVSIGRIAIDVQSTSLISSSAFMRMDTHRFVVMPTHANFKMLRPDVSYLKCFRMDRKKIIPGLGVKVYKHMQQGIRAFAGAVIHTTYIKGISMIISEMIPEILEYSQGTTSDDSTRIVLVDKETVFDETTIAAEFLHKPVALLGHCMMKDSADKAQLNGRLCEFNNLVIGPNGAIPQAFAHADLVIQPLISHNVARDILDSSALARSSIIWGDSPDLACAALWCYEKMIRQKWLYSEQELDIIRSRGFLPSDFVELVSGCNEINIESLQSLWNTLSEDTQQLCRDGHYNILTALAQFNFKDTIGDRQSKRGPAKINPIEGVGFSVREKIIQINRSRVFKGKLSGKYVSIAPPERRRAVSANFLNVVTEHQPVIQNDVHDQAKMLKRPTFNYTLLRPKRRHFLPQNQGSSNTGLRTVNLSQVMGCRFGNMMLTHHPTLEEARLARLSDSEFETWYLREKMKTDKTGFSFKSVYGYSLTTQRFDGKFSGVRSFVVSSEPVPRSREPNTFTVKGVSYTDVIPCYVGAAEYALAKQNKAVLAFAYAKQGDRCICFYKETGGEIVSARFNPGSPVRPVVLFRNGTTAICVSLTTEVKPFDLINFFSPGELVEYGVGLAGVIAEPNASCQYGFYLQSNQRTSMRMMSRIFKTLNCERPRTIQRLLPHYPHFPQQVTVVERAPATVLLGYKSIHKLRMTISKSENAPFDVKKIDLTGEFPRLVPNEELDVGYYTGITFDD